MRALEGVSFDGREGEWVRVFGLSRGLEQGMKLVSALEMGAFDVFDYAFRKRQAPTDLAGLKGKTIVLGRAGWQAIGDPMFASNGIEPSRSSMPRPQAAAAQVLAQGTADAARSWEGLRAQWKGQGLEFDRVIGRNVSKTPANTFVMRSADFEDAPKKRPLGPIPPRLGDGSRVRVSQPACRNAGHVQQFPAWLFR